LAGAFSPLTFGFGFWPCAPKFGPPFENVPARGFAAFGPPAFGPGGLRFFRHLDIAGQQLCPARFLIARLARQLLNEADFRQPL